MNATHPPGAHVRWLIAGAFLPSPSGRQFLLTANSFAEQLGRAASGLSVTVPDRIGSGDASTYEVSFDGLHAFSLSAVIDSIPDLRTLRTAHDALSAGRVLSPEEVTRLGSIMGAGLLSSAVIKVRRDARSPQEARGAVLSLFEEALYATARDILQHPLVTRLESAWRGLHWLWEHCPASAGMDIEILDVGPRQLVGALGRCLDVSPLRRPEACFIFDAIDSVDALRELAALGEQSCVPVVVAVAPSLGEGSEAWTRLRTGEATRWLCAAVNPVVMQAERQGAVRRECFTSPTLAVAALLAASLRDTRTFARLGGPGCQTRAPAVWEPRAGATLATEAGLSLREQERLAARGLVGVGGFWDSDAVQVAAAPTVYGGRDAATLPAQLLTGRIVRLVQELTERLPTGAGNDAVVSAFSRAAEAFLPFGAGRSFQLHARVVPAGDGGRGVHVRAALGPEVAGRPLQLELVVPLRG